MLPRKRIVVYELSFKIAFAADTARMPKSEICSGRMGIRNEEGGIYPFGCAK